MKTKNEWEKGWIWGIKTARKNVQSVLNFELREIPLF